MGRIFEITDFSKGLFTEGRKDASPEGTLRRNKGMHPDSFNTMKTRLGSTLVQSLNSHSLVDFDGVRFQGSSVDFYRAGSSIKTSLDGSRLTFAIMPPAANQVSYLFCSGGGDLFKVDNSGTVTQWGISIPDSTTVANPGAAGSLTGTYQYKVTFKNTTTGNRSNGTDTAVSVSVTNEKVDLTVIPTSLDPQVDARELWRTVAGGSLFFLLTTINDNVTTSYTDDAADNTLSSAELPVDNTVPDDTYEDCLGPALGRMWWARNTAAGLAGQIRYSPENRPEAVEGTIDVTEDDDGTQKLFYFGGILYVIAKSGIYEISGSGTEGLFTVRRVAEPGTVKPHTVVTTPVGVFYQGADGVFIFNGGSSKLVGYQQIGSLFRGETQEGIAGFSGVIATATDHEYFISNGVVTLAYNFYRGSWRNVGIAANGLWYERKTGKLQASFNDLTVLLEDEGTLDDAGTAINIEWEVPSLALSTDRDGILKEMYVEADTSAETLTVTLITDGEEITLPSLTTTEKAKLRYGINRVANSVGVRFSGSVSKEVIIYRVAFNIYHPTLETSKQLEGIRTLIGGSK